MGVAVVEEGMDEVGGVGGKRFGYFCSFHVCMNNPKAKEEKDQ